jgi:hypothetical protein
MESYRTTDSPVYHMSSMVASEINITEEITSHHPLLKVHEDSTSRTLYHLNKAGEVITKITHSYDYKQVDIIHAASLGDKLAIRDYITTGLYFFEMALQEGLLPLHASAIAYQGEAILFSAPSQTGKSTQAKLWKQAFPSVEVINDDKPILSCKDEIKVYGSPWSGKDYANQNNVYPLKALFFLEQGQEDKIILLSGQEKVVSLIKNTHRSTNRFNQETMITSIDTLIRKANILKLVCTPTRNAVKVTHDYLYGEKHDA